MEETYRGHLTRLGPSPEVAHQTAPPLARNKKRRRDLQIPLRISLQGHQALRVSRETLRVLLAFEEDEEDDDEVFLWTQ